MKRLLYSVLILIALVSQSFAAADGMSYDEIANFYGGSGTIYDRKMAYYGTLGYSGTLVDREMAWLGSNGYSGTLVDRWNQFYRGFGFSDRADGAAFVGDGSLTFWAPFTDPANPLALNKGTGTLSFTRAHDATHTATYTHPTTGYVTVADNNVARIEEGGVLIEGARANVLKRTAQFDNVTWVPTGTVTITPNVFSAPDGSMAADNITKTLDEDARVIQYFTPALNTMYTGSIYLGKDNVTDRFPELYLRLSNGGAEEYVHINTSTGATSVRFSVGTVSHTIEDKGLYWKFIPTVTGTSVSDSLFGIRPAAGTTIGVPNTAAVGGIVAWGSQVEIGGFASSYIPGTDISMSRNADVLTIASSGIIDNAASTIAMGWSPIFASTMTTGAAYYLFDAGGAEAYYNATDQKIYFTDGTNTVSTAALTFSANVAQKLAFRWGPSGLLVYRNGSEAATGATYTAPMLNANLYIGTDTSSANSAYSNIKPVRTWNREFSAAEMGTISQ